MTIKSAGMTIGEIRGRSRDPTICTIAALGRQERRKPGSGENRAYDRAQPASLPQPSLYWPTAILSKDVRKLALKRGQPSAAVQASMGKARILGLIIDRREVGDPGAFDDKTDEELMEEAKRRAAALGLLPPETQH